MNVGSAQRASLRRPASSLFAASVPRVRFSAASGVHVVPKLRNSVIRSAAASFGAVPEPEDPTAVPAAPIASTPDAPPPAGPVGVKIKPALIAVGVGLAIRFLLPIPGGLAPEAWSLLAIFVSTVLGLILDPLPVGAWAFIAVTVAIVTKTLSFQAAMAAMTNEVIWLIVVSFFFAKGFEKTGLGERVANIFVKALGSSTLGLSLGLNVAECIISPAMPSTSARAGGIFNPIIKSLSAASGSFPDTESRNRMGSFLTMSQFQTGVHTSNLFYTGSAQNLLCLSMAAELGAVVPNQFATWGMGALLPALIGTILTPIILYNMNPPLLKDTPEAPKQAEERLKQLGPMGRDESIMLGTMCFAVFLWIIGPSIGISAVLAAMLGFCILLLTGVLSWKECLLHTPAWDTLLWFAVLIGMSNQLNTMGLIQVFADFMGGYLSQLNMGWMPIFGILHLSFFLIHYVFASQTAHVGALYSAFCAMMLASGVPPVLAAMTLAYNINLFGSITHYASGQAAVYYGAGFMKLDEVFKNGFIIGMSALLLWGVVGMPWWKFLGWW
jgi:DASS family divalent anion:Na+ symporter